MKIEDLNCFPNILKAVENQTLTTINSCLNNFSSFQKITKLQNFPRIFQIVFEILSPTQKTSHALI